MTSGFWGLDVRRFGIWGFRVLSFRVLAFMGFRVTWVWGGGLPGFNWSRGLGVAGCWHCLVVFRYSGFKTRALNQKPAETLDPKLHGCH